MSNTEFNLARINQAVAILLVLILLIQSVVTWIRLLIAYQRGEHWFDRSIEPRATWDRFPELTALGLIMVWLALSVAAHVAMPQSPAEPMNIERLKAVLATTGGLTVVLTLILVTSHRPLAEYGLRWNDLLRQVRDGVNGYSLAFLPTVALLLMTASIRNPTNQNPLLTLLAETSDPIVVALIFITAAIMAPLSEEMMFRVILQGWLTSLMGPRLAIPLAALTFAAVHGPIDGVALLPLAGVLGYVFDRRHSYVSVLVIHGLFNATMLTLAVLTQPGPSH